MESANTKLLNIEYYKANLEESKEELERESECYNDLPVTGRTKSRARRIAYLRWYISHLEDRLKDLERRDGKN